MDDEPHCTASAAHTYSAAWKMLSGHLLGHWPEIVKRGTVDLAKSFPGNVTLALHVHLHFVRLLGHRLKAQGIGVDLSPFSRALVTGTAHPEVSLLLADGTVPPGRLSLYATDVSVLRGGGEVQSALWMHLQHPVAVKVCYLKKGAPVRAPTDSHPWHPAKQRKLVKLSPFKGDAQPLIARRDLRI